MSKTLIASNPGFVKEKPGHNDYLMVAEFFTETVQGEGVNTGHPSMFLRLMGCVLDCVWCDSASVWRHGNPYTFEELFTLIDEGNTIQRLKFGQHVVLTGGSVLKQEQRVIAFLQAFVNRYGFIPYIEVENEAVLMPSQEFIQFISCWNNSPKLTNSGMKAKARYKMSVIAATAQLENSWFKFVVSSEEDWREIERDFLMPGLVRKEQIILMPQGQDQKELSLSREMAADMAIKHGVRFSDRLHITLWDHKTGV